MYIGESRLVNRVTVFPPLVSVSRFRIDRYRRKTVTARGK